MGRSRNFAVNLSTEDQKAFEIAEILSAMGNGKRIQMLRLLFENEMSVGAVARSTGLSQPAASQHLTRLSEVHLITRRRAGQTIFYKATSEPVRYLIELCMLDFVGDTLCVDNNTDLLVAH
ncbi:ArsR/SmtB family transcription factor [Brucella pseudogrignonensis]